METAKAIVTVRPWSKSRETAEIACTAYRSIRGDEDYLAIEVYHAAHVAHLNAYAEGNPYGAAVARVAIRGLWYQKLPKEKKTSEEETGETHEDI